MLFSLLLVLNFFTFNQENPVYRAPNQITLKAASSAEVGKEYVFEGELYYVVNDSLLREAVKNKKDLSKVITTNVNDMSFLFYKTDLVDLEISSWDVSNVTTMSWMFGYAEKINPDLSFWDTQSVVDFSDQFHGTKNFNGDLSKWNTSNGQFFNGMFHNSNFNNNLNTWDLSSAKNTSGMFDDALLFNQPLSNWNTSNVENMGGMFAEAVLFNQDISKWNVKKVSIMTNMFRNAKNFKQNLSSWEVPLITSLPEDFSTNSPVIGPKWNISEPVPSNWLYLLPFVLIFGLAYYFYSKKSKRIQQPQERKKEHYETLRDYLSKKNSTVISKAELDELLGITTKSLESQKQIRASFVKEFNQSGWGEIVRIRDEFDSRSFKYQINWTKG